MLLPILLQMKFHASQIDLSWTDNAEDENGFVIEQKTTDSYAVIATVAGNVTSFSSTDLTELTEYTYRVSAFNVSGHSDYSNEVSATTEANPNTSSKIPSTGQDIKHWNYPNPFHETTHIEYTIPRDCFVSIKVYDSVGKELNTLIEKGQPQGHYSATFNGRLLSAGTYYYRIYTGDIFDTKKIVLIK